MSVNMPSDKRIIGDLHKAFRTRNDTCLYSGCKEKPINSHVISEKTLKLIAEAGAVLTWDLSYHSLIKHIEAGLPSEQFLYKPTSVGIQQADKVTCPLFCGQHDCSVFIPLEQRTISPRLDSAQIFTLAYRALSAATYDQMVLERTLLVGEQYGQRPTLSLPEVLPRVHRFLARDVMLEARERHEKMFLAQDYHQLEGATYLVNIPPCISCTYAFIPSDALDAIITISGKQTLTAEDVVVFSILPYPPLKSICVISWLKGSSRARVFLDFEINRVPRQEQPELFLSLGFQAPNVYMLPNWWEALSEEQKEYYTKIHLSACRAFTSLVYA